MDKSGLADALDYALQSGEWSLENEIAILFLIVIGIIYALIIISPIIIGIIASYKHFKNKIRNES